MEGTQKPRFTVGEIVAFTSERPDVDPENDTIANPKLAKVVHVHNAKGRVTYDLGESNGDGGFDILGPIQGVDEYMVRPRQEEDEVDLDQPKPVQEPEQAAELQPEQERLEEGRYPL